MKKLALLTILIITTACWYIIDFPINIKNHEGEYVVLLHGIKRTGSSMVKMHNRLVEANFVPINITYPSTKHNIDELADFIHNKIKTLDKNKKINFVTHSMGGLVAHQYIYKYKPENIGRVVMLSPPLQGSEVADNLKNLWLYKKSFGPAGQELGTDRIPPPVNFELGIITGDRSIAPVSSIMIDGKDDGKVSVENSKIDGMKDHITIHATHTFIMKNNTAIKQVLNFLINGRFEHTTGKL